MPIDCPKCSGSGGGPDPATSCNVCEGTGLVDTDEDCAFDALIFMAFLGPELDDMDLINLSLPRLTEEDRAALEKIDIEAIIARGRRLS